METVGHLDVHVDGALPLPPPLLEGLPGNLHVFGAPGDAVGRLKRQKRLHVEHLAAGVRVRAGHP
ncbi:hypothetical protein ES703_106068 [subsurface metagenome]